MQYILTLIFWHLSSKKQKVAQDPDGVGGSGKGAVLEALASYKCGPGGPRGPTWEESLQTLTKFK